MSIEQEDGMKLIDNTLLDSLTRKAGESPRHRAHFNLHPELNDPVQRLCIAMEPETYVRPHRHSDPETWEILMILRGSIALLIFDDQGKVLERTVLAAGGMITAVEFPLSTWHTPVSLESGTIVFEVKQGPYRPIAAENSAAWAPAEGTPEALQYLDWFRYARAGDVPRG
jgi:cupin fold WbuC family metalloprotein